MECVKTGFHAWLEQYGEWVYGDAFTTGGVLILRIAYRGFEPARPYKNYTIRRIAHWFDELHRDMEAYNSTMIVEPHHWEFHGYAGEPLVA